MFLVVGIMLFMVGMHGMDNAWNLAYVREKAGGVWTDSAFFGNSLSPPELYSRCVMVTFAGFLVSVLSGLMVFYGEKRNVRVRR